MKVSNKNSSKNMKEKVKRLVEKILEEVYLEIEDFIEDPSLLEDIIMDMVLYVFDENEIPKIFNLNLIDDTKKYKILDENGFWILN